MKKAVFAVAVGVMFGGPFAIVACVGDDPIATTTTPTPDAGTPAPTSSTTATTTATTTPPGDDDVDAGDAGADAGIVCHFANTPFPCTNSDGTSQPACYGDHQDCTITSCSFLEWACNSPRQCSNTPCCVSSGSATLVSHPNCTPGAIVVTSGATDGSKCEAAAACAAGEIQLCQFNADCPKNQYCSPVSVSGPASMAGDDVAVCVPY